MLLEIFSDPLGLGLKVSPQGSIIRGWVSSPLPAPGLPISTHLSKAPICLPVTSYSPHELPARKAAIYPHLPQALDLSPCNTHIPLILGNSTL